MTVDARLGTWAVAALVTTGVLTRPWRLPEAVWAVLGALVLVGLGWLPWREALGAVGQGTDVYLFLVGMMVLAELARQEGLFDWLAAHAARRAAGSAPRLFLLIYGIGIGVTVFLSNDATAVVLTPAVYAVARAAGAEPLPYLFICAFIANAASFVLPISNPANLVIFGEHMPPLLAWLGRFTLPSVLSIAATFAVLRWTQRPALAQVLRRDIPSRPLPAHGRVAAYGILATAGVLLVSSARGVDLGAPTCLASLGTLAVVASSQRRWPTHVLKEVSWTVLPMVAGLFVIVAGLAHTGVLGELSAHLQAAASQHPERTAWASGVGIALVSNAVNNLPAGLLAGQAVAQAHVSPTLAGAILIGVDLGPNLSVTGSLATLLWLVALRREGLDVGAWTFLKLGLRVMPPALLLALGGLLLLG